MPYDVRPAEGELGQARALAGVALDACERERPREDGDALTVSLAWAPDPTTRDALGGVRVRCFGPDDIELGFDARVDGWDDVFLPATARGYGHAWLRGRLPDETLAFWWQYLLAEAFADGLARALYPDAPSPWRSVDPGTLADRWPDARERLADRVGPEPLLADAPPTFAESLAAALGVRLRESRDPEAFPELTRSDVEAAGEAAF